MERLGGREEWVGGGGGGGGQTKWQAVKNRNCDLRSKSLNLSS